MPKQEKKRLIIDARNANDYLIDPDNPGPPNSGHFTALILEPDEKLFLCKV